MFTCSIYLHCDVCRQYASSDFTQHEVKFPNIKCNNILEIPWGCIYTPQLSHQFCTSEMSSWIFWRGQVVWLIKKLLSQILWRYIFICIDGHYVKITDDINANGDQARFSRRWFFASDSHWKIIGFLICWNIDLRAFLSRIIDYLSTVISYGPPPDYT